MAQGQDNRSPEERERAAAMDADIIALRRKRVPFDEIGRLMLDKYGRTGWSGPDGDSERPFTRQYMSDRYTAALAAIPAREAANHRAELGELFNQVIDEAYAIAQKDHWAHSNGRLVREGKPYINGDGEAEIAEGAGAPVLDDGPKLAALAEVRKAAVEVMRLYGLAVPVKQEVGVNAALEIRVNGVDLETLK
ncbi:hypothetical protein [Amycolatopsis sp. NPDC004378]